MLTTFLLGLTFFTRIPVPKKLNFSEEKFNRAPIFLPAYGLVTGGILALIIELFGRSFPGFFWAGVIIAGQIYLSGALHIDGLLDSLDAIYSNRDREKRLEILKDSRVGSMAVAFFGAFLILKYGSYASFTPKMQAFTVLISEIILRGTGYLVIYSFPYVGSSLGRGFKDNASTAGLIFTLGQTLLFTLGAAAFFSFSLTKILIILLLAYLFAFVVAARWQQFFGGLTGDNYGGIMELTGLFVPLAVLLINNIGVV
ncbi:adenosylcobinamide-GDP ribazoletransferase [Carboxydothermus ferrireducens]|uniref:Adenosylcobinamide-GDP ribazoletransferase n=1 Tax=Carboxydothermus ferrireducens DSM 11255 TaxID=1119529 RepID=A0ABX2R653_9THEO|nr:adenosylcobinamide-GDP ribazoletransferase [Carboxydothermus ferrireducens]NYE56656.1 adenosylcobinamide-GDP ribazoletransferase [Carboxydothermus ferrireducens DSM 11255]